MDDADRQADSPIELVIEARPRDIGGFAVRRVLPWMRRRRVGPFVFLDHIGPMRLAPGEAMDVKPHPHIGLATVTYLYEGEVLHRDSLGSEQIIRPGDVNWMVAGSGIVHSERTPAALRRTGSPVHGLQLWVALPIGDEEVAPSFTHTPADRLPAGENAGVRLTIVAGSAHGATSPVRVNSPTLLVDARLDAGAELAVPPDTEERAVYVVEGEILCAGEPCPAGRMLVLRPGAEVVAKADRPAHLALLGGAPVSGERYMWWNFVSSSKDRIEQAKREWKAGRFPKVPGDEVEFVPLPE